MGLSEYTTEALREELARRDRLANLSQREFVDELAFGDKFQWGDDKKAIYVKVFDEKGKLHIYSIVSGTMHKEHQLARTSPHCFKKV